MQLIVVAGLSVPTKTLWNVPDHSEIDNIGYDHIENIRDHLGPDDTADSENRIYYMFDTDAKKVAYFYTDDTGVSYASYWGDFSIGITINWTNGQGKEIFTYKGSGSDAILTDANGNTWEYVETDLITAQERLDDRK